MCAQAVCRYAGSVAAANGHCIVQDAMDPVHVHAHWPFVTAVIPTARPSLHGDQRRGRTPLPLRRRATRGALDLTRAMVRPDLWDPEPDSPWCRLDLACGSPDLGGTRARVAHMDIATVRPGVELHLTVRISATPRRQRQASDDADPGPPFQVEVRCRGRTGEPWRIARPSRLRPAHIPSTRPG